MNLISATKDITNGVAKVVEYTASIKGVQTAGSAILKSAPATPQIIFNNRFFKTVAQDVSEATYSQMSLAGYSDDVVEFLALNDRKVPFIRNIKKLLKKISIGDFRPSMLKLDRTTVNRLNNLQDEDFLQEAICYIFNNYTRKGQKIPKELMPMVMKTNLNGCDMAYEYLQNLFFVDVGLKIKNKALIFGAIKHEFTHQWQVIDIFRTKLLGEKFSRIAANGVARYNCNLIQAVAALPPQEFVKFASQYPTFEIMQKYRELLSFSPEKANQYLNAFFENTVNALFEANEQKRKFITGTLGSVTENSEMGKKAKLYFQYFKKANSLNVTSSVEKIQKYMNAMPEQEAMGQTWLGTAEYLFPEINLMIK